MIHALHNPRMGVNAYACARTESLSPGLHTSPLRAAFAPTGAFGSVPQLLSHSPGPRPRGLKSTSPRFTSTSFFARLLTAFDLFSATLCAKSSSTVSGIPHGQELRPLFDAALTGLVQRSVQKRPRLPVASRMGTSFSLESHMVRSFIPLRRNTPHLKCSNDAMKCALADFPGARWPTATKD